MKPFDPSPPTESAAPPGWFARLRDSDILHSFLRSRLVVFAALVTVILVTCAMLAPLIAPSAAAGRIEVRPYGSRGDVERAARELFAALRDLDASGVSVILASSIGTDGLASAIRDRLMRAAHGWVKTIVQ